MECMEAALKPSLRREMAVSEQNVGGDDGWFAGLDSGATAVAGEDFSVDDLLDFSNGELDGWEEEEKDSVSVSSTEGAEDDSNSNSGSFSCSGSSDDSESILAGGGLAVPVDDMAELEWVSRFFDDSLSESPLLYPTAIWKGENDVSKIRFEPVFLKPPGFPSAVPVKSRSKRPRTGRLSASSKSSESSSTSSCSTWSSVLSRPEGKPKKKARRAVQTGPQVIFQRQCSHCGVHRTPQWRTGPTGAKTLCNACGVRYKSGRLFPEYRPACSPTFSVEIHSNSHRKVLEMRRKKELTWGGGEIMAPTVRDFGK